MIALLLAACSEPAMHADAVDVCNGGTCKATVEVQSCEDGKLLVHPDPIPVPAPNNIEWTISTGDFKFPENGIVVDGSGFTDPQVTGNGKKFTVHDDHTDKGSWILHRIKYTVRVVRELDGVACAPNDPFIKNQ